MKTLHIALTALVVLTLGVAGSSPADEIRVQVPCWKVRVTQDEQGYARFQGENIQYLSRSGEPGIPYHLVRVLLPPDADIISVSAFLANEIIEEIPGRWQVRPMPPLATPYGEIRWPEGRKIDDNGRDIGIYGMDRRFPAALISRVRSGRMRQWRLAEAAVCLFQYNPVTKRIYRLTSGELVVIFKTVSQARTTLSIPTGISDSADRMAGDILQRIAVNFGQIAPRYQLKSQESPSLRQEAPEAPLTSPQNRYVIITTRAIESQSRALGHFVDSKQDRGFNVEVVTEDAWGGGIGDAAAENIRAWLQANYTNLDIYYVLLIGDPHPDWGDVPMKRLWPRSPDKYMDAPSDYYYADLTGNWDLDGDGYYGEIDREDDPQYLIGDFGPGGVDLNWEVLVGRIPYYGNPADLDHILAKIILYENTNPSNAAWRENILLPMKPSDANTPGYQLGEEIKDVVLTPEGWTYHRVYEEPYNLSPPPETWPCTVDNVTEAWNGSMFGSVFWWTHGSSSAASGIMDLQHAAMLNDQFPGFTFQASCSNAFPEVSDNLAYFLLKNGAIGTIGATRLSWYWVGQGTPMFPIPFAGTPTNSGMTYEYASRLIADEMESALALYELKQVLGPGIWMNMTVFNLYGDPSIGLFTTGWKETYQLTVTVNGSGRVLLDPAGGVYPAATPVTLRALPAEGCAFDGWSGDLSDFDNPIMLTMNSDLNVTAEFWCPPTGQVFELKPTDDAWVRRAEAGNDGSGNHLKIQKENKDGYLKFDLSELCGTITSATLRCITSLDGKRGTVHVHAVRDSGWDEATIEGSDAPAVGERLDSATAAGAAGQPVTWDVTPFVTEVFSNGGEFASLALIMTDGHQVYFSSKENMGGSQAPVLAVKVSAAQQLNATDDAWVYRALAGNDGSGNHLKIQKDRKDGYLKFDLRRVCGTVTSARLACITSLDGKPGTVHVHAVYDNDWDEATIEGTDAPTVAERLDSATAPAAAGQEVSWDVTAFVNAALSRGSEFASLALIMTDGYQVYFSSKENRSGSQAPVLQIE